MIVIYFDGSSKNGQGAWAFVVTQGANVLYVGRGIGKATSNEAEYNAAIEAVQFGNAGWPSERKLLRGDSKLVIEQAQGRFKIRAKNLKPLAEKFKAELSKGEWCLEWIPREHNGLADAEASSLIGG